MNVPNPGVGNEGSIATSGVTVVLQSGQGALMRAAPFNATGAPPSVLATR
jgi:hypothetical protein